MSTAHTPGPWSDPMPWPGQRFEIQGGSRRVAVVDRIEDARLIASAPAMLEALLDVMEALGNMTTEEFQSGADVELRYRVAAVVCAAQGRQELINPTAKAEGRS